MSNQQKFVLSYDADYDVELHHVIQETPKKRRSERIRRLILLGLVYERQQGNLDSVGEPSPNLPTIESVVSEAPYEATASPTPSKKHIKFSPPGQK